jgi:general secretion pathway protein K
MKINLQTKDRGIALMMVLIVVMVFSAMAALFAYSMKVETKLARNTSFDADFEWAARGGVEVARWVLANDSTGPFARADSSLNKWAGGPGDTNGPLAGVNLDRIELGERAVLSIKIVDNDSKFNINRATPEILGQALTQIGVDASLVPTIRDSILDWRDADKRELPNGAENDFYKRQVPPYLCKDAPIDDLSELLLVQGITPAMYWGSRINGAQRPVLNRPVNARSALEETTYALGFVDLFSAISGPTITFGSAKPEAFLVLPFSEQEDGEAIVQARTAAYTDGNPNPITDVNDPRLMLPEQTRLKLAGWVQQGYVGFKSLVFEATVTATIGGQSRTAVAVLRRNGPADVQVLSFWWK